MKESLYILIKHPEHFFARGDHYAYFVLRPDGSRGLTKDFLSVSRDFDDMETFVRYFE